MKSLVFETRKLKDGHNFTSMGPFTAALSHLQKYTPSESDADGSRDFAPNQSFATRLAAIEAQASALALTDELAPQIESARHRSSAAVAPSLRSVGTYQQAQQQIRDLKEELRQLEARSLSD